MVSKDSNRTSRAKGYAQAIANKATQAAPIATTKATASDRGGAEKSNAKAPVGAKAQVSGSSEKGKSGKSPKTKAKATSKRALKRDFLKKFTEKVITPNWFELGSPFARIFDSEADKSLMWARKSARPGAEISTAATTVQLRKMVRVRLWDFIQRRVEPAAMPRLIEKLAGEHGYVVVWEIIRPQLSSSRVLRLSSEGTLAWAESF